MEMSELPEGWRSCQLADVTLPYQTRDPLKQPENSFTYIDLSSIDNELGRIVNPKTLLGKDAPSRARKVVKTGDVVFATTRPYLKGIALVPAEHNEQVCSTGFSVLRARPDVLLPQWLYYGCRSDVVLDQVLPHMRGASYPAVTDKDVLAATIPIPPLPEQHRIVARIEELAAKIERARELRQEAMQEVEAAQRASLPEWFSADAIESWSSLGQIVERIENGWSPQCLPEPAMSGKWGVLKVGAVSTGRFVPGENKALPPDLEPRSALEIRHGDFLMGRANTTELTGTCAIAVDPPPRLMLCDKIFRFHFKATAQIDVQYLDYALKSEPLREQIEAVATGTSSSMKNISKEKVMQLRLPLPPLAEQQRIVGYLNNIKANAYSLKQLQAESAAELDALLPAVLARAFRGEL